MKKGILFLVLLLVLQSSFVFADKKLDTKDKAFDLKNYERSVLSNEITLTFEGVLEDEISYDMTLNQSEKFKISVEDESSKNNSDNNHYQIKVYDENGKLIKVSNIKIKGEFSEASLDFNLGDYINVAMGYDIEISNSSNGGKVVISAAPSIGYIILIFYAVVAGFLILRIRKG